MQNFKYYCLFVISIIIFVGVYVFVPQIYRDRDLMISEHEQESIDLYDYTIENFDILMERYTGNISKNDAEDALQLALGMMKEVTRKYANTTNEYKNKKADFVKWFGCETYAEYSKLYLSQKPMYSVKNIDDPLYYTIDPITIVIGSGDIGFNLSIEHLSGEIKIYEVKLYNEVKEDGSILKILPRVEV